MIVTIAKTLIDTSMQMASMFQLSKSFDYRKCVEYYNYYFHAKLKTLYIMPIYDNVLDLQTI